ncbi:hypothetical protein [Lentilactobacillus farraginis]|uniref:Extracellular protein n=1 Tax=Lentilactobacillus farraginis DSM 18382 = JCM 14108 TaxID=1423743 RepID=A0A0R1VZD6_9LACO|nr:hypothetical protein [Lentilactobacillus farraginis]KRM11024.1 hypothetical protein FD41_GL001630 [Lentilactobacillus farraginis DSM 18382 = JCM 14108]
MHSHKIVKSLIFTAAVFGSLAAVQTPTAAAKWTTGMPKVLQGRFTSRYAKTGNFYPTLSVKANRLTIATQKKSKTTIENLAYRRSTPVSYVIKGTYKNGGRTYLRMMFGSYQGKTRVSYKSSHLINGHLRWTKHYAGWFYQK